MDALKASDDLAAKGATAPRVSLEDIENAIAAEYTTTADLAFAGMPVCDPMKLLTLHLIVLKNGFTVLGKSAPASADNFDAAKGFEFARQDAIQQIWPLMGFALRDRLSSGG